MSAEVKNENHKTSQYHWVTPMTLQFMSQDYLLPGQTVDERVNIIAHRAEDILKIDGFAAKFVDYMKRGWFSLSTPIWSNFGTDRGLPISCFGSNIEDDMGSILFATAEIGMMSKYGGGTSAYIGKLRPRKSRIRNNGESSGSVHFVKLIETVTNVVSQGGMRRGNNAVYLDIEHGDIHEFLTIRSEGSPLQDINFGVVVSDVFMKKMIGGDKNSRDVWAKVLATRAQTGYPYILFVDNANNSSPYATLVERRRINASNLCSEIMLPSNEDESFVCDLSSMNILHFDEWKGTDAVETLVYFLDAVMTEFIEKACTIPFMERAVRFAHRHRALGVGWLGWHSYLQSKLIPFESMEAKFVNVEIAKTIKEKAYHASIMLGMRFGNAPVFNDPNNEYGGRRNSTLCAIAPTKSSAFILGQVSEGIEPHRSNYYIKDLAKGKFTIKNPALQSLFDSEYRHIDQEAAWESILARGGSVQHLEWLKDEHKAVFKTFAEISPKEIVIQAAARQKFIDQGQSLNLMIGPDVPIKDINALYIFAWEQGVKSLYYQIPVSAAQEFARNINNCVSCSA